MNGKARVHTVPQARAATPYARGHAFIGPEEGMPACGDESVGRLWAVQGTIAKAEKFAALSGNSTSAR